MNLYFPNFRETLQYISCHEDTLRKLQLQFLEDVVQCNSYFFTKAIYIYNLKVSFYQILSPAFFIETMGINMSWIRKCTIIVLGKSLNMLKLFCEKCWIDILSNASFISYMTRKTKYALIWQKGTQFVLTKRCSYKFFKKRKWSSKKQKRTNQSFSTDASRQFEVEI